jgi:hypothetical protein
MLKAGRSYDLVGFSADRKFSRGCVIEVLNIVAVVYNRRHTTPPPVSSSIRGEMITS